jgi:urease accessory protein
LKEIPEKLLNLIRISDTFYPMGSFTISQGMEQVIAEDLLRKEKFSEAIHTYLEKVWKSFDFQIFNYCLEAAQGNDIETLLKLDNICYASKIAEENRTAMVKMGTNLLSAMDFEKGCLGASYKELVHQEKAHGTYPVALAVVSNEMDLGQGGGISLIYVNLIEVVASLVRMAAIDYIEAQNMMTKRIKGIKLSIGAQRDLNQSFPLIDIASMRHELNQNRMFIS